MQTNMNTNADETKVCFSTTEAKRLAAKYETAAFVYQAGVDANGELKFNYSFGELNRACGVLVARFDKNGKSF